MLPYITVGLVLAVLALLAALGRGGETPRYTALGLMIAFAGFRYHLGYDWLGYEKLFDFVPGDWDFSQYDLSRYVLATEPIFYALNVVLKSLGGTFDILLVGLTIFNLIVIDRMANKIAPGSECFVWLVYFCIAMLAVQFNIIRQAAASSFVIMALLKSADGRNKQAAVWFIIGLGFQVSILVFLPIFLVKNFAPKRWHIFVVIALMISLVGAGQILGVKTLEFVGGILPEFIGSKTDNYIQGFQSGAALSGISPFAVLLVVVYLYLLTIFLRAEEHRYVNIAIYLTLLVIAAHVVLAEFPSFWNRVMCVSLPWQLATLWGIGYFRRLRLGARGALVSAVASFSIAVMTYQLSRPESVPFVPYHSLAQVWILGDEGNGRLRAEDTIRVANLQH